MTLVGTTIQDRYRVDALIGKGAVGQVYAAVDLQTNGPAALKVMHSEAVDPSAPHRFVREGRALAQLRHPNVIRALDMGVDVQTQILFVVMEYARGDDLSQLIGAGRLPQSLVLTIVEQAAAGLAHAHENGIVHRDIKPGNLKLVPQPDGTFLVKILDFGFAHVRDPGTKLTRTGVAPGTMSYMAPEQLMGEDLDGRSDLYALGVIGWEMFSGKPPFASPNSVEVAQMHMNVEAPLLSEKLPERLVAPQVSALIASLLSKDRENRPASASELCALIQDLRQQLSLPTPRVSHMGSGRNMLMDWGLQPRSGPPPRLK